MPWLAILGIGEAGVETLSAEAARLLADAVLVVGGARHLQLAAPLIRGETLAWRRPIEATLADISSRAGQPVAVLASGDPFQYGAGPMFSHAFAPDEWVSLPALSSVSLAANLLGWSLPETAIVSLCGRPLATLIPCLQPGARILVLSEGAQTPRQVAHMLRIRGAAASRLTLLERIGGPHARRTTREARQFDEDADPLNILGIEVDPDIAALPIATGLDDGFYEHDGQLTRHELRAAAIAALAPHTGETLWDVGAGAGSVGIEWMRLEASMRAVAFERHDERRDRIGRNAQSLGVPGLVTIGGEAPDSFADVADEPDAVFLGGGGREATIAAALARLRPGGRLAAHSVTIETDMALFAAEQLHGGTLTRFGIERLDTIGRFRAFRPAMTVTQWSVTKR